MKCGNVMPWTSIVLLLRLQMAIISISMGQSDSRPRHSIKGDNDNIRSEFVRSSWSEASYKSRAYSILSAATFRYQECYSCMSLAYRDRWERIRTFYHDPKVFTNRCNDPSAQKGIGTTPCATVCVSLMEPDVEAGVFMDYKFIRGCLDRIVTAGFNESALVTHRFRAGDTCRTLPRQQLFNPAKDQRAHLYGDVQLCTCYGDRCNGMSLASSNRQPLTQQSLVIFLIVLSIVCFDFDLLRI